MKTPVAEKIAPVATRLVKAPVDAVTNPAVKLVVDKFVENKLIPVRLFVVILAPVIDCADRAFVEIELKLPVATFNTGTDNEFEIEPVPANKLLIVPVPAERVINEAVALLKLPVAPVTPTLGNPLIPSCPRGPVTFPLPLTTFPIPKIDIVELAG